MGLEQLKTELHQFIDKSDDEMLLEKLKLAFQKVHYKGDFWHDMSRAEQEDIEQGLEEIKNPENLIKHSVVMERFSR